MNAVISQIFRRNGRFGQRVELFKNAWEQLQMGVEFEANLRSKEAAATMLRLQK